MYKPQLRLKKTISDKVGRECKALMCERTILTRVRFGSLLLSHLEASTYFNQC